MPLRPPATLDAFGARIVAVAGQGADVPGRGLAQRAVPLERQVAVGVIRLHRGVGDLAGHRGRRHVGVEVLQPQQIGVPGGVGGVADLVDPDSRDVPQP